MKMNSTQHGHGWLVLLDGGEWEEIDIIEFRGGLLSAD